MAETSRTSIDASMLTQVKLKKVESPQERKIPTLREIEEARAWNEVEREQIPKELLPKDSTGRTHLDLIPAGVVQLKKVECEPRRYLPTADEIVEAKKQAENEPEVVPNDFLPKDSFGRTHLDLIKKADVSHLKKIDPLPERPLPTADDIEAERRLLTC